MAYPIHTRLEYHEKASRLTTFFRGVMVIPHWIVLIFYAIAAAVVAFIAWFAILFTGRYPRGMFDFQLGYLRYQTRVLCYALLLTDRFPPFGAGSPDDGYPIQVSAEYPEHLSRLTTFFRYFMAIPAAIVRSALYFVEELMAFIAWWAILFTGRLPGGLYEIMELPQRYMVRYTAYAGLLVTDRYPWFQPESEPDVPDTSWNEPLPPSAAPPAEPLPPVDPPAEPPPPPAG